MKILEFVTDIKKQTLNNNEYRNILFTGEHVQLVVMSIPPGGEIPQEVHTENDQFIRIESGNGILTLGDETHELSPGVGLVIEAGVKHHIQNTDDVELKLYTLYSPPHHPGE